MATAKKITIHDVALAAGVSVSTVSLVLSGKGANLYRHRRTR
ncbi:Repressor of malXY [Escherichia coli]|nr:Repressor of malXY [Escherichia coli]